MVQKSVVNCNAEIIIIGVLAGLTILLAIITMVVIIMLCRLQKKLKARSVYFQQTVRKYDQSGYEAPPPSLMSYNELHSDTVKIREECSLNKEHGTKQRHTTAIGDLKFKFDENDAPPKPKRTFETTESHLAALYEEIKSPVRRKSWPCISGNSPLLQNVKCDQFVFDALKKSSKSSDLLETKRDSSMQTVPEKPGRKRLQSLPDYENIFFDKTDGKTKIGNRSMKNEKNSIQAQNSFAFPDHSALIQSMVSDNDALRRASAKSNIPRAISGKKRKSDEKLDINLELTQEMPKKRSSSIHGSRSRTLPHGGHGGFRCKGTHERTKSDVVRQPRTPQLDQLYKRIHVDYKLATDVNTQYSAMSNGYRYSSNSDDTNIREIQPPQQMKQSSASESNEFSDQCTIFQVNDATTQKYNSDSNVNSPVAKTHPTKPSRLRQPVQYTNVIFRKNKVESNDRSSPRFEVDEDKDSDNVFVEEAVSPICGTMERREVARVVQLDLKSEPMTEL